MYNGVGIRTPRGTGTNGYIQRNAGQLAQGGGRTALLWNTRSYYKPDVIQKEKGKDIQEHERKRAVELRVLVDIEEMEAEGKYTEEQLEEARQRLRRKYTKEVDQEYKLAAAEPKKSLEDFAKAFAVPEDYKEGEGFDRELQESKRLEQKRKREAELEEAERRRLEQEIEEEERKLRAKKEEKERIKKAKKEAKKAKKEAKKEEKRKKKEAKKAEKKQKKEAQKIIKEIIDREPEEIETQPPDAAESVMAEIGSVRDVKPSKRSRRRSPSSSSFPSSDGIPHAALHRHLLALSGRVCSRCPLYRTLDEVLLQRR
eukprot:Sspe_Gene.12408::Locus_4229_Transcript_1_4_Confidence_0.333_Length_1647::g.12408::m.12408